MEIFELGNLKGVKLTHSFEKYVDGTITIRIENGKPLGFMIWMITPIC